MSSLAKSKKLKNWIISTAPQIFAICLAKYKVNPITTNDTIKAIDETIKPLFMIFSIQVREKKFLTLISIAGIDSLFPDLSLINSVLLNCTISFLL